MIARSNLKIVVAIGEQSKWYVSGPEAITKMLGEELNDPQPDPPGPIQRSNEIYERHLRLKKRGHPLWIPQSNMVLPIPYRVQGVRPLDVGIFTENGGFDFLFNICVPRDDPINPRELPENFIPISPPVNPTDIRKFAEFSPGSYLTSSSVAESRTADSSYVLCYSNFLNLLINRLF